MKNYISHGGYQKLLSEYEELLHKERPKICEVIAWAAGNGDRSENADYIYGKKRLREIDKRLRFLAGRLEKSEVVDYLKSPSEKVLFGASVELENENGVKSFIIVGADEIETKENKISYLSPIGKALMGKSSGDVVLVNAPKGDQEWRILKVHYQKWD